MPSTFQMLSKLILLAHVKCYVVYDQHGYYVKPLFEIMTDRWVVSRKCCTQNIRLQYVVSRNKEVKTYIGLHRFFVWPLFCCAVLSVVYSFATISLWKRELVKLFSCSTQLSTKFQLLLKTRIPTNEDVFCFKSLRGCINHANKC